MNKVALYGGLLALIGVGSAYAAGDFPGYPIATSSPATGNVATIPLSGFEAIPADTRLIAPYATFTGVISGTTLTASSITGNIAIGQNILGANVQPGTQIVSGSGTSWVITPSQTVASTAMSSGGAGPNPQTELIQTQQLRAYALSGGSVSTYVATTPVTVATLPSCVAALNGAQAVVSNGVAYSLTLAAAGAPGTAVSTGTGTVSRGVMCGSTDQSTFAWVYK